MAAPRESRSRRSGGADSACTVRPYQRASALRGSAGLRLVGVSPQLRADGSPSAGASPGGMTVIAAPAPPPFVWLVAEPCESDSDPVRWMPVNRRDNDRLESALAGSADGAGKVQVDGGRYDVDLKRRVLEAVYWDESERKVLRSLWFRGNAADRTPYDEVDSSALEESFQRLRMGMETSPLLVPVMKAQNDVRIVATEEPPRDRGPQSALEGLWENFGFAQPQGEAPKEISSSYTMSQESVNRVQDEVSVPVWRGYYLVPGQAAEEPPDDPEADLPERIECLVFVVHGIGQYHRIQTGRSMKFHSDVATVRKFAVQRLLNRQREGLPVPGRIEFLPLKWFDLIHVEGNIGTCLKQVTLPSVPALRDFANFAVADIMVYQDEEWSGRLHQELWRKMVHLYTLFKQRTPDFSGEVAVVGHSLGSVIMFDLMQKVSRPSEAQNSQNASDCEHEGSHAPGLSGQANGSKAETYVGCPVPRCLFGVGSPLGMFLSIRLSKKRCTAANFFEGLEGRGPNGNSSRGWRFFNVFHPDDPVAYRVEPLLDSEYANIAPQRIAHQGGLRFHHAVLDWWRGASPPAEETADASANSGRCQRSDYASGAASPVRRIVNRMDFVLQEFFVESLSEFLSALRSHLLYWESEDCCDFIVDSILLSIDPAKGVSASTGGKVEA